jgi:hypothetical protein
LLRQYDDQIVHLDKLRRELSYFHHRPKQQ